MRIRYADDEEARDGPLSPMSPMTPVIGLSLTRAPTNSSISSARSGRGGLKSSPALAIPIEYRTLSFNLEDTRQRQLRDARTAKDKATAGMFSISPRRYQFKHSRY